MLNFVLFFGEKYFVFWLFGPFFAAKPKQKWQKAVFSTLLCFTS